MSVTLANGGGFPAGFAFLLLLGVASVALLPVSALVAFLKGKKFTGVVAGVLAGLYGLGLVLGFLFILDTVAALGAPIALLTLVPAFRMAKPGSWWYRRRYGHEKQRKATWAYSTKEGRSRRMKTSAAATGSIVVGLAAGVYASTGIEDLLTTTLEETRTEITLYVVGDPAEAEALTRQLDGDYVLSTQFEPRHAYLGPDENSLLRRSEIASCLYWDVTHQVIVTIAPPHDEILREVLSRSNLDNLTFATSWSGDLQRILGVAPPPELTGEDDEGPLQCEQSILTAMLDPRASDSQRDALADAVRTMTGVKAVAIDEWRYGQEEFAEYPGLLECYGPGEMKVFLADGLGQGDGQIRALLAESVIVKAIKDASSSFDEESLESGCEDHELSVELVGDISDPDAAVVIAALRRVESVVSVKLNRFHQFECEAEDCPTEASLSVIVGNTAASNEIADAICELSGVRGIHDFDGRTRGSCAPLWLEVRLDADSKLGMERVEALLSDDHRVSRVRVQEPRADLRRETVLGHARGAACDPEGESYWQVSADLVRVGSAEMLELVSDLKEITGVLAVLGNIGDVGLGDSKQCGYEAFGFWLARNTTAGERDSFVELLDREEVWAVEMVENRSHVGTETDVVDTGWEGVVYVVEPDLETNRDLLDLVLAHDAVVHAELVDPEYWEALP